MAQRRLAWGLLAVALLVALLAWRGRDGRPTAAPSPPQEQCGRCHLAVQGLEAAHAALGCAACHLGQPAGATAEAAHAGLVRLPGNLADAPRTCGAEGCHVGLPWRLEQNVMTTMNGVVSVDRWVFGEQPSPTAVTQVSKLGHSPADSHLRNLCASCHLGNPKTSAGPVGEDSRGGGCLACHLRYSPAALLDVGRRPDAGFHHPRLDARVDDASCFGCHSRSGRVSLNAAGWREGGDAGAFTRTLADGRVLTRISGDVHTERGLGCTDCHGSWEVMGMGTPALHREDQAMVQCDDCHRRTAPVTRGFSELDAESARLAARSGPQARARRYVVMARGGFPLVNTFVADGGVYVEGKASGRTVAAAPPAPACLEDPAHRRLSCGACHDAWAPQCTGCHTRFDPAGTMVDLLTNAEANGEWHEAGDPALAEPASLGMRALPDGGFRVEEFAPGMVMTLEPSPGSPARFVRLFAPVTPHTVQRAARGCADCHANALALGYGRGALRYERGRWSFSPARKLRPEDGLPEDAWIGFLKTRGADSTTRETTRPFTVAEQQRVLTVGACLGCHGPDSPLMQQARADFKGVLASATPRCRTPRWD
jgi:hypothetical protein